MVIHPVVFLLSLTVMDVYFGKEPLVPHYQMRQELKILVLNHYMLRIAIHTISTLLVNCLQILLSNSYNPDIVVIKYQSGFDNANNPDGIVQWQRDIAGISGATRRDYATSIHLIKMEE